MAYPTQKYRTNTGPVTSGALYALGIIAAIAVLFAVLSGANMSENSVSNARSSPSSTTAPQPGSQTPPTTSP